eukprot:3590522-Alexandrium_andersonii.AAC.1
MASSGWARADSPTLPGGAAVHTRGLGSKPTEPRQDRTGPRQHRTEPNGPNTMSSSGALSMGPR